MKNFMLTALFGKTYAWTFIDGRWSLHRIPEDWPASGPQIGDAEWAAKR